MADNTAVQVQRGIELLQLCQKLQSDVDGINRPGMGDFDKSKTVDAFSRDISQAIMHMQLLRELVPMMEDLTELGRKLETSGAITVIAGENYAKLALEYLKNRNYQSGHE